MLGIRCCDQFGASGLLVFATESYDGDAVEGFDFFTLDTGTGVATKTGSAHRGSSESDPGYYAGFFRAVSHDGSTAFRLGYKLVTTQGEQGLGSTTTTTTAAGEAKWTDLPVAATGYAGLGLGGSLMTIWTVSHHILCAAPCRPAHAVCRGWFRGVRMTRMCCMADWNLQSVPPDLDRGPRRRHRDPRRNGHQQLSGLT